MNRINFIVILILASLFISFACQKHLEVNPPAPIPPDPPVIQIPPTETDVIVTASIQGRITDQDGTPIKDATVTSGSNTVQTDINGFFRFSGIQASKYFGFVSVFKTGFFTGSRTIITSVAGVNYVQIVLLPKTSSGQFDAAAGATITSISSNSLTLPANAVEAASSNATYSGTVHVYSSFIDPTDPTINGRMPGDFRGTDTSNRTVGLQTFGIVAIELEGSAGERLQLASGKTATIRFPIPANLQATAPSTIPLWYFNDTTGRWIEQGVATKNGSNYVGNVAHFTYWSLSWPTDLVYIIANLKDQIGNPLAYARVIVTNTMTNDMHTSYSDSVGNVNAWVYKNTVLSFDVIDNCGNNLASKAIGPFTGNQDIGAIIVSEHPDQMVTVHGRVLDCSHSPVANGFASINIDGLNYGAAVIDGRFTATILKCSGVSTSLKLLVGDYATQVLSDTSVIAVMGNDVDAGELTVCSVHFDQYFIYNIDGNSYNITDPPAIFSFTSKRHGSPPSGSTIISASTGVSGTSGYMSTTCFINLVDTGTTKMGDESLRIGSSFYATLGNDYSSVTVTRYDGPGGYIQGFFSGNLYVDSAYGLPARPVTGSFKVKVQ